MTGCDLREVADALSARLGGIDYTAPVAYVYDPTDYAREPYRAYLRRFGTPPRRIVLVGMNPGPWGMVQTGVPFGEVTMVRDWMGIEGPVEHPRFEHPSRPVLGFACRRSEVSGRRLWGWAAATYGDARAFFADYFVANYCPLAFFDAGGRNLTPDKLPATMRAQVIAACDKALRDTVMCLEPELVVGIGRFAETRARDVLTGLDVRVGVIPHPSPASPVANRGWEGQVRAHLEALGVSLPPA